jgi:hypothetical protein
MASHGLFAPARLQARGHHLRALKAMLDAVIAAADNGSGSRCAGRKTT